MSIKVTDAVGTRTKTVSKIDLGLSGAPKSAKQDIIDQVGSYLVEQVLLSVGEAKTPVAGESWPVLSKNYKKKKIALGGNPVPNMELEGDMLNSLTFKPTPSGIELGFFNEQAWKADGHLKFSGKKNNTPQRRFLPGEGESFKAPIVKEVERIIGETLLSEINKKDLKGIETKAELYAVLSEFVGTISRSEIRDYITGNPDFFRKLQDLDLIRLL